MSQPPPEAPPSTAASPAPTPARKGGKWRRRLVRAGVALLVLLVAFRLLFAALLPTAINRAAALYGLTCDYERSEMNLLSGDVGLWHLTIAPLPGTPGGEAGAEPLARIGYVRGNISTLQLLKLNLEVWRAEADGVELVVERQRDGRIPLLDRLIAALPKSDPSAAPPAPKRDPNAPRTPLSLAPPLTIDALRLQNAVVHLRDRSVTPEFTGRVLVDFRLSDVNSGVRPTTLEAAVWSEPGLDLLRVEGTGRSDRDTLEADLRVLLRGLQLDGLGQYLRPLGIAPAAEPLAGRAAMRVRLTRAAAPHVDAVAGQLTFSDAQLTGSAGKVVAAVKAVTIDLGTVNAEAARVDQILVSGGRVAAGRNARGNLEMGGIELVGGAAPSPRQTAPPAAPPTNAAPGAPAPPDNPYLWSIGELKMVDCSAEFDDAAVPSGMELTANLDALSVRKLAYDPARRDVPAEIALRATIPGVAGVATASGTAAPFADGRPIRLSFRAGEIRPDRLRPYFDLLQLESQLQNGELTAELASGTRAAPDGSPAPLLDLSITDVKFRDVGGDLLSFPKIVVTGARVDTSVAGEMPRFWFDDVELVGPEVTVRRDPDGLLAIAGTRRTARLFAERLVGAAEAVAEASTQPAADASGGIVLNIPRVELKRLSWTGVRLAWVDETTQPPTQFGISDATVRLENLLIDLAQHPAGAPTAPPTAAEVGTIHASLAAPGIVEALSLDGKVAGAPGRLQAEFALSGSGITGAALRPYLEPAGISTTLTDGRIAAKASASVSQEGKGVLRASLAAGDVAYTDGGVDLAGVDALSVAPIDFADHELRVGTVTIDRPRASVGRDEAGAILAGGLRMDPAAMAAAKGTPTVRPAAPATQPAAPAPLLALDFALSLQSLELNDGRLSLRDAAAPGGTPVELTAIATAAVEGLVFGQRETPPPARFQAELQVSDVLTRLTATGTLTAAPHAIGVAADVQAAGIRPGRIAAYFPAGIEPTLADGRFSASFDAALSSNPAGGYGVRAAVERLDYADGDRPLAKVGSAKLAAGRIDLAAGVFVLETVATRGVEADVEIRDDGTPALLGIAVVPVPPAPPSTQPVAAVVMQAEQVGVDAPTAPPAGAADSAALVAASRKSLPLLTLDTLDVQVDRITVVNRTLDGATPATLADLRLRNLNPLAWGGPSAAEQPPTRFEASLRLDPLVRVTRADATVAPFAEQPSVKLVVAAEGVRGDGLTDLIPPLRDFVDGQRLTDGRLALSLDAQLSPDRRGGVPDYTRGFGADLTLRETTFRNGTDGPVLAGVEQVHASGVRVEPGGGNLVVKTLEITNPTAYVLRDAQGVEVLGLVAKVLPAQPAADEPAAPAPAEPAEPAVVEAPQVTVAPSTQPALPGSEVRIDRLLWSGLDLRIDDRTVTPPIVLPITGLDLDAAGLSTRALVEPRPIRFNAVLTSGKVPLPKKSGGGGMAGALGDLGGLMGGKKEQIAAEAAETEERELFSQVAASGRVLLYPAPSGWVKTSVNGLELLAIRGFAESADVTLGGGVFDSNVDLRLKSDADMEARTLLVFTDLKLSEPENGPIARHLKLPAPLDAVIAVVQDADGSITLRVNVPIKQGELDVGAVVASGVGALGQVLATAVASTPVKAVTGVGALVGIGGGDKEPAEPRTVTVDFPAGDASLTSADAARLAQVIDQLRRDKHVELTLRHELTAADVNIAGIRANPSPADAAAIAASLRQRRADLLAQRVEAAGRARSQLATLTPARAQPGVEALRDLDRQIAATDAALDAALDLLRPGADRQAARRARTASIDLGQQRLGVTRALLLADGLGERPGVADRVRVVNAGFSPADDPADGGRVVITIVEKKK